VVVNSSYDFNILSGSQDYGNLSEADTLHVDVNGDGLLDQVTGAPDEALHVRLNLGQFQGFGPEIIMPGYVKTGLGFDCGDIWDDTFSLNSNLVAAPTQGHPFPSADVITKWVAHYAEQIRITGKLTRQESGGDGMVATLLLGNTKLWEREITPLDMSSFTPADPGVGAVGSACGSDTIGLVRTVAKGDRLYTRVNA